MALRIGALILASCTLLDASLISFREKYIAPVRPTVSSCQLCQEHQSSDRHQLGTKLKSLGFSQQRQHKSQAREENDSGYFSERYNFKTRRFENGEQKQQSSKSRQKTSRPVSPQNKPNLKPTIVIQPKPTVIIQPKPTVIIQPKPTIVIQQKPTVVIHPKPVFVAQPKPIVILQNPKPPVLLSSHEAECQTIPQHVKTDDDHIDKAKTVVSQHSDKQAQNLDELAKASMDSVEDQARKAGQKILINYNNILKSAIKDVAEASIKPKKTVPTPAPTGPSIPVPVIVQKSLAILQSRQQCESNIEKLPIYVHQQTLEHKSRH